MRVTTAFNRLLDLDGLWVRQMDIGADTVVVEVAIRRRLLRCPHCGFTAGGALREPPGLLPLKKLIRRFLCTGSSRSMLDSVEILT